MTKSELTEWQQYELRIALLEVCSVDAGIGISDVRWHPRILPYVLADNDTVRAILKGLVVTGLIFQRGHTSGKVYRTTHLGGLVEALFRLNPPPA